jgi:hypothetical protein
MSNDKYLKAAFALRGPTPFLLTLLVGFSAVNPAHSADTSPAPILEDPGSWTPQANGCLIQQSGNRIRISGTNNIDGWGHGNGIASTKYRLEGDFFATVDFAVPQFKGSGNALVYVRAKSSTGKMVAILYQPNAGTYQVQGWGTPNSFSQPPLKKIGDEEKAFHRLKLKYESATKTASGWVDDQFIGTLNYAMTGIVTFELLANTDKRGVEIDLLFNDLSVTSDISTAPPTPPARRAPGRPIQPSGGRSATE